jgi:uncharacterized membrane protein
MVGYKRCATRSVLGPTMKRSLGRYVYGLAAIAFGVCACVWHDISNWVQITGHGDISHRAGIAYIVAAVEILGGLAVLWQRTARAGAAALGALYFAFAVLAVPSIVEHPLVYNGFGHFFEQFAFVSGAGILYACCNPTATTPTAKVAQAAYYSFGICVVSFALEQLFYLSATASLVPTSIPFGQMFWAVATTVAFALAAIALLTGLMARLASRLTALMLAGFALLVWLPALLAHPHSFVNWTETAETVGIAGCAWMIGTFLSQGGSTEAAEV